ncbi:hypothetical protein [Aquirufa sp. Wall-65K1]
MIKVGLLSLLFSFIFPAALHHVCKHWYCPKNQKRVGIEKFISIQMNLTRNYTKLSKVLAATILIGLTGISAKSNGTSLHFTKCCTATIKLENRESTISVTKCRTTLIDACDAAYREARKAAIALGE